MKYFLEKAFKFSNEHIKQLNLILNPKKDIKGTSVHQLCYQPESSVGLKTLEQALTEKPNHEHAFKMIHNKMSQWRHKDAAFRANQPLHLRLEAYQYEKVFTPLVLAAISGNTETIKCLNKHRAQIQIIKLQGHKVAKFKEVDLWFDNAALYFSMITGQFKAFKLLAKNAQLKSFAIHSTVQAIDYRAVLKQDTFYDYSYLHLAISLQNKSMVSYLIEKKGMLPTSTCCSPISQLTNSATKAYEMPMFEFLTSQHLKLSFALWYIDSFKLHLSNCQIEKIIDLCGSKQRFEQILIKEGLQHNICFQKYLHSTDILDKRVGYAIEKLFDLENPSLTHYQKNLVKASSLNIRYETYPSLVTTLHSLPFFEDNPVFRNLLCLYMPLKKVLRNGGEDKSFTPNFNAKSSLDEDKEVSSKKEILIEEVTKKFEQLIT